MLFAADVHKDALIGLGVALLPGVALNDGVLTLVERAGLLGIFRYLCRQLVLLRLQLLLLGRAGDLVPDQPYKHSGAYDDQHRKYDPLHQKLGAGQPAAFSHLGCPLPRHAHYCVWLII